MIIPTFYGGGGEQTYFEMRELLERWIERWAGRPLTLADQWALDKYLRTVKRRTPTCFEDRALESLIEEAHAVNT